MVGLLNIQNTVLRSWKLFVKNKKLNGGVLFIDYGYQKKKILILFNLLRITSLTTFLKI